MIPLRMQRDFYFILFGEFEAPVVPKLQKCSPFLAKP